MQSITWLSTWNHTYVCYDTHWSWGQVLKILRQNRLTTPVPLKEHTEQNNMDILLKTVHIKWQHIYLLLFVLWKHVLLWLKKMDRQNKLSGNWAQISEDKEIFDILAVIFNQKTRTKKKKWIHNKMRKMYDFSLTHNVVNGFCQLAVLQGSLTVN